MHGNKRKSRDDLHIFQVMSFARKMHQRRVTNDSLHCKFCFPNSPCGYDVLKKLGVVNYSRPIVRHGMEKAVGKE